MGGLCQLRITQICTYYDPAWIEIVIKGFGLTQEFRTEQYPAASCLLAKRFGVSHRNSGLYDHHGILVIFKHLTHNSLNSRSIEKIAKRVIIGRRCNHDKGSIRICFCRIQGSPEIKVFLPEILLHIFVLHRRNPAVDHIHLFRHDINRSY